MQAMLHTLAGISGLGLAGEKEREKGREDENAKRKVTGLRKMMGEFVSRVISADKKLTLVRIIIINRND